MGVAVGPLYNSLASHEGAYHGTVWPVSCSSSGGINNSPQSRYDEWDYAVPVLLCLLLHFWGLSDLRLPRASLCLCPWIHASLPPRCWSLPCWNVTKVPWRRGSSNNDNNNNDNAGTTSPCNRAVRHWPS